MGVFSRVHGKDTLRRVPKTSARRRILCQLSVTTRRRIRTRHNRGIHLVKKSTRWRGSLPSATTRHSAGEQDCHVASLAYGWQEKNDAFLRRCLQLDTRQTASSPGVFWRYTTKTNFQEGAIFPVQLWFFCAVYILEGTWQRPSLSCVFWMVHGKDPLCLVLH
jgi:hypothetical protein